MVVVEQWAEVRRMHRVEGLSGRRSVGGRGCTGTRSRGCWRRASRRSTSGRRRGRSLICSRTGSASSFRLIRGSSRSGCGRWPARSAMRAGSRSSTTMFGRFGPRFVVARTFQRTIYRPGELAQCDLWEPREQVPVGHGQRRRGWVVTCEVCWSRVIAGTLIFSKEAPDILWGLGRNLQRLGALPEKLVWDRESAIAAGGRPTDRVCRVLRSARGRLGDPRGARSAGEGRAWSARIGSCARTSSRVGCSRTTSISRTASMRGRRR